MRVVNCSFKLVYTDIVFNKKVRSTMSGAELKGLIKNDVLRIMNLDNFSIATCGSNLRETNTPINNESPIRTLLSNANSCSIGFYIKPTNINNNDTNITAFIENTQYIQNYIEDFRENPEYNFTEFNIETIIRPIIQPIIQPIIEPIIEPITDPTIEPITDPITDPIIEPTIEPTIEPLLNCPVCYEDYRQSENIQMGCHHNFCRSCIQHWFVTERTSCPLCRA